ncbi:MAG: PIG-L deacetylase family protein [Promethearchaeota archaeon]
MKLLIINAHPDDAEFMCASTCLQAVDLGWEVHEILMTSDEYGTSRDDFKGKRIRRIRKHEMLEAAKVYGINDDGTPKINLIWFGEIDGYLPFNRDIFERLKHMILGIDPDIIIGPDSFFTLDYHPDHMCTGWLLYLIVKDMEKEKRPLLLLYHSTATNFFIPVKERSIQVRAWSKHRSQTSPLKNKILYPLRNIFYLFRRRKTGLVMAEGFRKPSFVRGENEMKKLKHKFFHYLFRGSLGGNNPALYLPTPEALGLR